MISYKDLVGQICVLFRLMIVNDLLQRLGRPNMSFLDSMIVNDPLQSLGSPKLFLFGLYGRQ